MYKQKIHLFSFSMSIAWEAVTQEGWKYVLTNLFLLLMKILYSDKKHSNCQSLLGKVKGRLSNWQETHKVEVV